MWGKSRDLLKITLSICLCASLSFFSSLDVGASTLPTEPQTTIVMSTEQWTTLKQELTEQTIELNQLRQKLKMLRSTSGEQIKLLESLQNDLSKTQENLMSANVSLTACRNELKDSRASLQTLKKQIRVMEHKQVVVRRQRDVYATLLLLSVGAAISGR